MSVVFVLLICTFIKQSPFMKLHVLHNSMQFMKQVFDPGQVCYSLAYMDATTARRLKMNIAERLQRSRKGFLVGDQSPMEISRELSFEHALKTVRD